MAEHAARGAIVTSYLIADRSSEGLRGDSERAIPRIVFRELVCAGNATRELHGLKLRLRKA
jgi:hypothetical protein